MEPTEEDKISSSMLILDRGKAAKAYESALRMEVEGHDFYRSLASASDGGNLRAVFTMLAEEERSHFERIDTLFETLLFDEHDRFHQAFMGDYKDTGIFPDLGQSPDIAGLDEKTIIEAAIEIENRTIRFFAERIDEEFHPEIIDVFNALMKEELMHIKKLEQML